MIQDPAVRGKGARGGGGTSPEFSVSRRRPRRSSAKGTAGLDSTRVQVRELACATANSSGRTRGRMGALPWRAAAPGGVARPQSRRRAIVRRFEGKQGLKGVVRCSYLCATRRRLAEGRSGGAEMDSRQHGGAPSSAELLQGAAGPRSEAACSGKLMDPGLSSSCGSRWWRRQGAPGTRNRGGDGPLLQLRGCGGARLGL